MLQGGHHDHSNRVALSVVPLLQERFRQLQRMKELRQEQELLRMLSESERSYITPPTNQNNYHQSENYFPESQLMVLPPKPQCQLSLTLWPDSSHIFKHGVGSGRSLEAPTNLSKSKFSDAPVVCTLPIKLDLNSASDIDTSLRL